MVIETINAEVLKRFKFNVKNKSSIDTQIIIPKLKKCSKCKKEYPHTKEFFYV